MNATPDAAFAAAAAAIRAGNADALAPLLNTSVELTLPGADEVYPAQQATFALKDFFAKNPAKSFQVIHQGNSGSTQYATGTYVSGCGNYDTTIFTQNLSGACMITQLRFEAE
jgi:hypothetical protein